MRPPGAVLCGGASRRMGRDKALLEIDGVPLAAKVARALEAGGCGPVVLVGGAPTLSRLGWPWLPDAEGEGRHPLWGVAAALEAFPVAPRVVMAACDLVGLTGPHVTALLAEDGPGVAVAGGRRHPLLAALPPALAHGARQAAAAQGSVRGLVAHLPDRAVPAAAVANLNTPGDLAAWRSRR